jgi:hypothetical protein
MKSKKFYRYLHNNDLSLFCEKQELHNIIEGDAWVGGLVFSYYCNILPINYELFIIPKKILTLTFPDKKLFEYSVWFVSYLNQLYFQNQTDKDGYYGFGESRLYSLLGKHRFKVIKFLETHGVIDINHSYQQKVKTKTYRLNPNYYGNIVYVWLRNVSIAKKMKQLRQKKRTSESGVYHEMMELIRNRVTLPSIPTFKQLKKKHSLTPEQLIYWETAVFNIRAKILHGTSDDKTGRFFSNITNLPRDLRPYLRIDCEKTVEIDIKTAQPLFLITLYDLTEIEHHNELSRFKWVLFHNDFYTYLAKSAGLPINDRQKLKEAVYVQIFFDKLRDYGQRDGKLFTAFRKEFPILCKLIEKVKTPEHNQLAIRLQGIEAKIMIHGVAKELMSLGIPFATVHDSVIVKEQDADIAQSLIEKHTNQTIGVKPKCSRK